MPFLRRVGPLALTLCLLAPLTLPAVAGPAENALLAKYEGIWKGTGKVVGPDPGKVACRMTFKAASAGKLTYSGRCTFGSGGSSFRGTMVYNDATKRFEAISTAQGVNTTTTGKRQGNGIVFSATSIDTRYGSATSTMALASDAINMTFKLVDKDGDTTASSIKFTRS